MINYKRKRYILRRNCLLQQVIEGKIKGQIEVTRKRGRRRKKLLDDLKDGRGYYQLKEEALDRSVWRNRFGRGFGPVVWQITDDDDDYELYIGALVYNFNCIYILYNDMDVVGVMAAWSDPLCVCVVHCIGRHWVPPVQWIVQYSVNRHDRTILVILAKYCTRLPDDGSSVIRNMLEHF